MSKVLLGVLLALASCEQTGPDEGAFQKQGCNDMVMYFDDDVGDFEAGYDSGALIESQGYREGALIPDTFDEEVAEIKRGREGMAKLQPINSEWIQLTRGKTIGKQANLLVDPGTLATSANLLEVVGPNDAAMQLCITLLPPKRIYNAAAVAAAGVARATGEEILNPPPVPAPPEDGSRVDLFATIEWGIGGVSCSAEVDYKHGTQVNIHASWVRVTANAVIIAGVTEVLTLGAFIGPGMAKPDSAERTEYTPHPSQPDVYQTTLATGSNSQPIPIPNFARAWRLVADVGFGVVGTPPDLLVRYLEVAHPVSLVGQSEQISSFDALSKWYTVPNGMHFLVIENQAGAPPLGLPAIIFKLSI